MSKTYFNLSKGGAQILQSASRIYAAYVTSGRVPEGKEKEWMRRALKHAMSFAKTIDELDDSPKHPAAVATGAAIAASVAAGATDESDPDDTAGHEHATDEAEGAATPTAGDSEDSGSPDDTGIELTATTDEQTVSDDDVLAAIMGDEPQPQQSSAAIDPSAEMMDELPDTDQDMSLDSDDDFPAEKPAVATGERTSSHSNAPTDEAALSDHLPVASETETSGADSSIADDDELDIDENVLAAFADTGLDAEDVPVKPDADQATAPAARVESNDADESGEAIEFLSTLAEELPPAADEPADMDDIMSALMDDAAEPTAAAKPADSRDSTKPEPPMAIDDGEEAIAIAEDNEGLDAEARIDAVESAEQDEEPISKTAAKPDQPRYADLDEPTNPTEANLAATHLPDDLSFELVDEDIDMNKLIEDAITATEKKDESNH